MELNRNLVIGEHCADHLLGDSYFEIAAFIHIEGKDLQNCRYKCLIRIDTNDWVAQDANEKENIDVS